MKKDYLKPMMEVVEVQLSDYCAAGSGITVPRGKTAHYELDGDGAWEASSETLF